MRDVRIRIVIRGAVQGVGFRPFVYRLAQDMNVNGWVSNSNQGVFVEAEGTKTDLDRFLLRLEQERPSHASIHSLEYSYLDPIGFSAFEIRSSDSLGARTALVLPDIATCSDCLAEVFNPVDRRHLYPFTNCTNCGPRFSIVERLPYDRCNTTMRGFTMCEQCRREYEDPLDRRFHAQPNACAACGPKLELWDESGRVLTSGHDALLQAVELIKSGSIVAVKGLGGFHFIVDAANDVAVTRLRERKNREDKPFAVMAPSLESACKLCNIGPLEERALRAPEAPIVLLERQEPRLAESVAPKNPYLGILLPYTPLHHILLRTFGQPVVATSGNRGGEPICTDEHEALARLGGIADAFLVHDRPIRRHVDDSIVRVLLGREQVLRRARGFAPLPIVINRRMPTNLAVGSHLKNTVALAIPAENADETHVFISQHIGDLETKEAFDALRNVIGDLQQLYEAGPEVVLSDMHPDYASSQYAAQQTSTLGRIQTIQHHCAHVASCMAENALDASALGVAWDGTGYGGDGTIWGGEFLRARDGAFERVAHLRTFPLAGGDAAARSPRRSAIGVLYEVLGEEAFSATDPPVLRQMLHRAVRCPRTSSAGRLFDAVASLIDLRHQVTFEGQAAMELEFAIDRNVDDAYGFAIRESAPLVVDWEPMILQIVDDVQHGATAGVVAARFHNTLAAIIVDVALRVGEPKVVLTGGCFQNRYLTERTVDGLARAGLEPYWHQRVPPNDGGIAFGQVAAVFAMENTCVLQSPAK